jgi:hypothetical protein
VPPLPLQTAVWQSPGVCEASGVPEAKLVVPQTPLVQVRATHSFPVGGQSVGELHCGVGWVQTPLVQVMPPGQSLVFLHLIEGGVHTPATQVFPAPQVTPHPPQLFGSVATAVQVSGEPQSFGALAGQQSTEVEGGLAASVSLPIISAAAVPAPPAKRVLSACLRFSRLAN